MISIDRAADRQQRAKAAHRSAIATAAVELARENGPDGFSAVQLADRADVSRRTVFNHFASIDDAINAGLTAMLDDKIQSMMAIMSDVDADAREGEPGLAAAFDDITGALLSLNLLDPMREIADTIVGRGADHPSTRLWVGGAIQSIIPIMIAGVEARAPESTPLERTLLAQMVLTAVEVTFTFWYAEHPGEPDAAARDRWMTLFAASLDRLRAGFAPTSSPFSTLD